MAKKPTIVAGQRFTDKNGDEVVVTNYVSATKVEVQWHDGTKQFKSAQQLRTGKFSQRTRNTKAKNENTVEQPYQQQDDVNQELSDDPAEQINEYIQEGDIAVSTVKPSRLFAD